MIEALEKALKDQGFEKVADYFDTCTDARRSKEYGRIMSAIKQLASMPHHDFSKGSRFANPEARTLVRLCEAFVGTVGEQSMRRESAEADNRGL